MLKMQVIGHLGKDAIINKVNEKQVINFSVAHTEKFIDQSRQQREKTIWVECSYWSDSRVSDYLKKGTQVYLEGIPDIRQWEANGKSGVSLTLRVLSIQLLSQPNQQAQPQGQPWAGTPQQTQPAPSWGTPPVQTQPAPSWGTPPVQTQPAPSWGTPPQQTQPAPSWGTPPVQTQPQQTQPAPSWGTPPF